MSNHAKSMQLSPDYLLCMQTHPVQHSKVKCAEAVALMHDGKYKAAARRFTEVRPALGVACLGQCLRRGGMKLMLQCRQPLLQTEALPPWAQSVRRDISGYGPTLSPTC